MIYGFSVCEITAYMPLIKLPLMELHVESLGPSADLTSFMVKIIWNEKVSHCCR